MLYPFPRPLERGLFLKRYKRFFVEVEREGGACETVHCANTGSMRSCLSDRIPLYTLRSDDPARKLACSLELAELSDGLACLNTARANLLVSAWLNHPNRDLVEGAALLHADLPELKSGTLRREAKSPLVASSRFDFLLSGPTRSEWIELKTVTLRLDEHTLAWPDSVSERGAKHARELARLHEELPGNHGHLWFVLMRGSALPARQLASGFRAAHECDPAYAQVLAEAVSRGLRIRIVVASIGLEGLGVRGFFRCSV